MTEPAPPVSFDLTTPPADFDLSTPAFGLTPPAFDANPPAFGFEAALPDFEAALPDVRVGAARVRSAATWTRPRRRRSRPTRRDAGPRPSPSRQSLGFAAAPVPADYAAPPAERAPEDTPGRAVAADPSYIWDLAATDVFPAAPTRPSHQDDAPEAGQG